MNRLRFWLAMTLGWVFTFYNIERFHETINIASFVYIFAAVMAIGFVVIPTARAIGAAWLVGILLIAFFSLKLALGYGLAGTNLPITVTEICAIGITLILVTKVMGSIEQFEDAATRVMLTDLDDRSTPFREGQERMYLEVRRARRFGRPLLLVRMSLETKGADATMHKLIQEVQREAVDKYLRARIADVMAREISDCDIVATHEDHFVLVMPEADRRNAFEAIRRIKTAAQQELGMHLKVGTAAFPGQEVTLAGLLERAETDMSDRAALKSDESTHDKQATHDEQSTIDQQDSDIQFVVGN